MTVYMVIRRLCIQKHNDYGYGNIMTRNRMIVNMKRNDCIYGNYGNRVAVYTKDVETE